MWKCFIMKGERKKSVGTNLASARMSQAPIVSHPLLVCATQANQANVLCRDGTLPTVSSRMFMERDGRYRVQALSASFAQS